MTLLFDSVSTLNISKTMPTILSSITNQTTTLMWAESTSVLFTSPQHLLVPGGWCSRHTCSTNKLVSKSALNHEKGDQFYSASLDLREHKVEEQEQKNVAITDFIQLSKRT